MNKLTTFVLFVLLPSSVSAEEFEHAVVSADHPLASEAGAEMLRAGGNVVDAAVATSFTLSVVRPYSCGIGGGGFLVMWDAKARKPFVLDYRERAPKRATRRMYLDADVPQAEKPLLSREGGLAPAIPGTVAGLCEVHRRFGKLPLKRVLAPAIRVAREGWPLDNHAAGTVKTVVRRFESRPALKRRFEPLWRLYLNEGRPVRAGDRVTSPQLPALERIAEHGHAGFYDGPLAKSLLEAVTEQGGLWTAADLGDVRPVEREPLRARIGQHDLLTMPPPSSGGIALIETLHALDAWDRRHPDRSLAKLGHNTPDYVHVVTEAMKHAFADRAEYLGDTDFVDVPVDRLVAPAYGDRIARRIRFDATLPTKEYGRFAPVEDDGTSHFSIIDAEGNAIACTETVNTYFGSYVVDPTYGIVLNNEMDDFAARPGEKNVFGLVQSEANTVATGKKPLSSMSPTIAVSDGKAVLAVGASGGPRIVSSTLQVFLNVTRFDLPPAKAVAEPRFHHQWLPNELVLESGLLERVRKPLSERGHDVKRRTALAITQLAIRGKDGVVGVSDPRKGGRPAGW